MSFAHPWLLLGLSAALIPLLVHLFDRRRARPQAFSAISFVLRSQKRTTSRLKLKRLLLYCLRTLILLAIPLALARPQLKKAPTRAAQGHGAAATAIVLDASLGMRFSDAGESLFGRGQEQARSALRGLAPEEPSTVLVCTPDAVTPPPAGFDRGRLRALIDEARPSYGVADMTRCLGLAAHALEESPMPAKRLVVVSAFFANGFHLEVPPPTLTLPDQKSVRPELVLRDVARDRRLPNRAIVSARAEAAPQVGPRAFQFTFTVQNGSDQPVHDLAAALQVDGQVVAKAFLDVPAQGSAQKTLTYRFPASGPTGVSIVLSPDGLTEDDRRVLWVDVPRPLKALLVNGEPNAQRYRDEAFFLEAALSAPGTPVQATVEDADVALKEDLGGYDVVELLNVPVPTEAEAARLRAFVDRGGGLFIAAGDHVEPDAYNARLGDLLPSPIRVVKTAVPPGDPDAERRAERLKDLDPSHPLFTPFFGKGREGLFSARFYRYLLLEANGGSHGQVLATFGDGAPALVEARRGRGRVLVFTSTVDRDWTDLPIRTSYLPLMQRLAAFLAGALTEREPISARVGQTAVLHPDAAVRLAAVRDPDGREVALRQEPSGAVAVGPLPSPGLYRATAPGGEPVPSLGFAASLDPLASDLTRLKPEELAGYFGEESVRSLSGEPHAPVPLWSWLLLAAAAAFVLEGALLFERRSVGSPARPQGAGNLA